MPERLQSVACLQYNGIHLDYAYPVDQCVRRKLKVRERWSVKLADGCIRWARVPWRVIAVMSSGLHSEFLQSSLDVSEGVWS